MLEQLFQMYCLLHNPIITIVVIIIITNNNTFLHELMVLDLICLRKVYYTYRYLYFILCEAEKY